MRYAASLSNARFCFGLLDGGGESKSEGTLEVVLLISARRSGGDMVMWSTPESAMISSTEVRPGDVSYEGTQSGSKRDEGEEMSDELAGRTCVLVLLSL